LRAGRVATCTVVLALCCGVPAESAQSARSPAPAEVDDMRAVRATPAEAAEGRNLTENSCARCHGIDGISNARGVPHLAGQRAAYLYAKLRAYQSGAHSDHSMESAVKYLNDDALVKVSAYYASLEPAAPAADLKPGQTSTDPLAVAKALTAACVGCHGENGVTKLPGTPSLVALDPKYFVSAMNAYKTGQRKHDVMKGLTTPMTDTDMRNIAVSYALQKPMRAQTPASGDAAAGKALAGACAGCHGENGISSNPANPSLAGQDTRYLVNALKGYKDGSRKEETMKLAASSLADKAMEDMAAFYSQQEPRAPKVEKPLTLAEWVNRCDRCHGINGNSTDPRAPAIAAQRVEYLQKALRAYQAGRRKSSAMAAMAGSLAESDVDNLASYYARQRARAVVFVPLPAK
jgi:cytochrome c553